MRNFLFWKDDNGETELMGRYLSLDGVFVFPHCIPSPDTDSGIPYLLPFSNSIQEKHLSECFYFRRSLSLFSKDSESN